MLLTLIGKIKEAADVKTFIFRPQKPIVWEAGQYLIYSLPHDKEDLRGRMRFFTISKAPFEKNVSITTRIVKNSSTFKKTLDGLKIGEQLNAKGPDGDFIIKNYKKDYVFIAGGIGITPFRSILKQLEYKKKNPNILLFYACRNDDIVFKKELDSLKLKNLKITFFVSKKVGKSDLIKIKGYTKKIYYISGPDPMVDGLEKILTSLKVPKKNINLDYFSGYEEI